MTAVPYDNGMRSLTVRLPDQLVMEIEAESRERNCAKSDVVRKRLQRGAGSIGDSTARLNLVADLIGSVDGLPADLSGRKKEYLKTSGYGKKRAR
jgi:Arc/MetJ-type ribon-helix-helix transcriptional regulator